MELSHQILSQITTYLKYARWLPEKHRRETWEEIIDRSKNMHLGKFPNLTTEIEEAFRYVYDKKVLPSMRAAQFAGKPIEISPSRSYNCSAIPISHPLVFSEIIFLLLGGSGVGFSVQYHHIEQLPEIRKPINKRRRFLVNDSIEGWADTIKVLMTAYFEGRSNPDFDFRDIRPKGTLLRTSGGRAPGPQPLIDCVHNIRKILDKKVSGTKLTSLECHDILCHIADAVLSGGIRRAALLSLFSMDDEDMLNCKYGNWAELNPQRGRANNSAMILRHRIEEDEFFRLWEIIKSSRCGEPNIYFSNDTEYLPNPCAEISIRVSNQGGAFCNLTTFNVSDVFTQKELNNRARVASFIGTLQAAYTDFHYLRAGWKRNTERDALLGVSPTGIAVEHIDSLDFREAAEVVLRENERVAKLIGINRATRTCTCKPSGTSSLTLATSSGIQAWHDKYYIRRIRVFKHEAIYKYMKKNMGDLVEDDFYQPNTQAVINIPVAAPEGAITKDEPTINLLERIKKFNVEWIRTGHRQGANYHNVSATVYVKNDEWDEVGRWMWDNREYYNGITVLPYDGGTYKQMPFESCSRETYEEMMKKIGEIDLSRVSEIEDHTSLLDQAACAGGKCSI